MDIVPDFDDPNISEEVLREYQAQLRTIFKNAPQAIIVIAEDSTIVRWNPKAEEIFGWSREEALGQAMPELIMPPRYREAHRKGVGLFLRTGEARVLGKTLELSA